MLCRVHRMWRRSMWVRLWVSVGTSATTAKRWDKVLCRTSAMLCQNLRSSRSFFCAGSLRPCSGLGMLVCLMTRGSPGEVAAASPPPATPLLYEAGSPSGVCATLQPNRLPWHLPYCISWPPGTYSTAGSQCGCCGIVCTLRGWLFRTGSMGFEGMMRRPDGYCWACSCLLSAAAQNRPRPAVVWHTLAVTGRLTTNCWK